jgi:ABC-type antimicrobial peptide transport system permease subunit
MRGKSSELKNRGLLFKFSSLLPSRLLRGAAKNLTRNRTRSFLTVVAFTIALTFSGSLIYTDQSIGHTIDTFYENRISFDVEVNLGSPLQIQDSYLVNQIITSPAVERSEYFLNNLIQLTDRPDVLTYLLAYQYNTSMYDLSDNNILEGRWYNRNTSEIVISRYLEGTLGITIGEELVFDYLGARFNVTVVGVTNDILFNSALLGDFDYFNSILAPIYNQISAFNYIIANKILLQLKDGYSIEAFQNQLNLENTGIDIALTKNSYERRSTALSNSQTAIIYLMVTLGLVVGMVSVFTTLLIAVVERERELALLQVFGYKKHELLIQIILEGWIIGVISLIPTFFLARIVSTQLWVNIVSDNLYKVYSFFPFTTNITLSIFAIGAITISILPAFRSAVSKKIAETIREE